MATVEEVRIEKLRALIKEAGTAAALSRKTGVAQAYITQLLTGVLTEPDGRRRTMGAKTARKLEIGSGKPEGWMDDPGVPVTADVMTPQEVALLELFRDLTPRQREEEVRRLEDQKQSNDAMLQELLSRRKVA